MDSKKLLCVLQKFKGNSKDKVFEKFSLILNKALVEDKKTPDEKLLSEALEEETLKFQEMRQKFFNEVEGVRQIEGIIREKDDIDPSEYFNSRILYSHTDSCECLARQAFEYGVAYGKMLAT